MCKLVIQESELGLLKWMRTQKPPCPCDFRACLELAEQGGAVRAYLQTELDLGKMCGTETENMTATETADAVALIDQGVDNVKDDGAAPLHWACQEGHAEVVMALLEKGADVDAKNNDGYTPLHCVCWNGHHDIAAMRGAKGTVEEAKDAEYG